MGVAGVSGIPNLKSNACDSNDNVNEAVDRVIEEEERVDEEEILVEVGTPFDILLKLYTDEDKPGVTMKAENLGFVRGCRDIIIEL
ncbi:Hypothetical predicted protein [Olea europaea subsp. europaea]|uniref:Uncharacterized protein n=1 Tax=Olea europaea subsp. europaea TaxID=158383 RepID=A0A8S0UKY1_OLEEU|nr:Hypothetical predicted protein [Olea europaea subsp. europaea]